MHSLAKSAATVGPAAATASKSTSRPPKKSLDATAATAAAPTNGVSKETDATTTEEPAKDVPKSKSRSQSRKRSAFLLASDGGTQLEGF